jgi:hypothetical protein
VTINELDNEPAAAASATPRSVRIRWQRRRTEPGVVPRRYETFSDRQEVT